MNKNFTLQKKMKGVSTLLGRGLLLALLLACSCLASAQTPRVRDEGTHWTPTYGYNGWCTITAQVSIDGVPQTSEDLEVGAFIDNECRASWKLEEYDTDVYVVYLSVNGQYPDDNGKTIAFQLYDHAQNMVLPLTCTSTYQWADNASWGDMEPVAIEFSNNASNHAYVDLGLPSGTLWATCNVGANSPEEYGDHFAWGETQPKDFYDWSTYQYCNGSFTTLTKYCNHYSYGYNGFTDNLTTLLPEDDAATAHWGAEWRMPTKEELQELYQNTTHTWATQNDVAGRLFTAANGNSIFLPAAGNCSGGGLYGAGGTGDYWSRSLGTDYASYAWGLDFNDDCSVSYYVRTSGKSVRPVRSPLVSVTATPNPEEGGTIGGTGGYNEGQTCTLTATANEDYTFINWTENGEVVSVENPYTFTVTGDRSLVANFEATGGGLPTNGLVAYYPFNGNPNDESGNENHGSLQGNMPQPTTDRFGNENSAYLFGGYYNSGYIHVPNSSSLQFDNAMSMSFWLNLNGYGGMNWWGNYGETNNCFALICKQGDRNGFNTCVNKYDEDHMHLYSFNSNGCYEIHAYPGYSLGEWMHCVVTIEDNLSKIYVNGVLVQDSIKNQADFSNANQSDMYIGIMYGWWYPFNGKIDDVAIYNRALTEEEVQMLHGNMECEVIVEATEGGTATGGGTFNHGETCTLTATPDEGYIFTYWTVDDNIVSYEAEYSFPVLASRTYKAHFSEPHTITATANLEEGGTIEGTGEYGQGTQCTLTATPNEGYVFINWMENGQVVSTENPYTFTVAGDRSLVANFLEGCSLTIEMNDSWGDGWNGNKLTVSDDLGGYHEVTLDGGSSGSTTISVPDGSYVTLSWITGSYINECSFNIRYSNGNLIYHGENMNGSFYYEFDMDCEEMPATTFEVTATADPAMGGTFEGTGSYAWFSTGTLTAIANDGYVFAYWTENGSLMSYDATISFTVTSERHFVAHFDEAPFNYHYELNPNLYSGTMAVVGVITINNEEQSTSDLELGAFWNEECRGRERPRYYPSMDRYLMFLTLYGNAPDDTGEEYTFRLYDHATGEELDLTCITTVSFADNGVLGDPGDPQLFEFLMQFDITATANPEEGGTVTGAGTYEGGSTCTLTATPNEGYTFTNWTENGEVVSTENPYTFTVTGDRDLVANFRGSNLNFEEDLVAYYPFDGDVNDYSGNGNHGTIIGNVVPATDRHGNTNGAYRFPGYAFNYVSVPDAEILHLNTFTLSAWVYSEDEHYGQDVMINKGRDINNGSYRLSVKGVGAQNEYSGINGVYVEEYPEIGQWHMITGTVEGDQARFYVDGVLISEATLTHPFSYGNTEPLTLGCHYYSGVPSSWAYTLNGIMDEVRIYSRVLTPDEVMNLYNYSEGSLSGLFSVSETTRVNFSQGNLQYKASTNTWRFAENQWDYAGAGNDNISETYDGWIDLFGWGTSGYNHGANAYQPWSTSQSNYDYWAYGDSGASLSDSTGQADWGYNAISNGGNHENMGWRTMTIEEWTYLLETRNTASGIRYAKAQVNGYDGMVVLPDNWNASIYDLNNVNYSGASFGSNVISAEDWMNILEPAGTVFLPKARLRVGTSTSEYITRGDYWSSSHNNNSFAFGLCFENNGYNLLGAHNRYDGKSVRLVKDANSTVCQINAIPEPEEGGTLMGMGIYMRGDTCTLTATANTGYTFMYWTENGEVVSNEATYSFTVYRDRSLVAHFTLPFAITATADPVEGGTISGAGVYNYGQTCTLTATANEDYTFMYWTENGVEFSTEPTISFTVDSDRSFVAHFTLPFAITATADPVEGGTISGTGEYDYNSTCTLTATANEDYYFVRWTKDGEVVSSSASLSFVVTEAASYVAHFDLKPVGMVTAMYDPDPDDNQSPYVRVCWDTNPNTNIFEDFETGDFSKFGWETNGWGITDNNPHEGSFCMKSNNHGHYSSQYAQVTVQIPGDRQMSFWSRISSEGGWDFGRFYIDDQEVGVWSGNGGWEQHVYDVAAGEHTFKWAYTKDGSVSYNDDCFYVDDISFFTVARGGNRAVDHYEVYRSEHPENGSWERIADNVTDTCYVDSDWSALAEGWYKYGVVACYVGNDGTTVNESYMVRSNQILRAYPHTITATADPAEGGTITGAGDYVLYTECTLTATPNEGYTFINWTENGEEVTTEPTFSFTVTTERNLVAHFTLPFAITATAEPAEGGTIEGAGEYDYNTTCTLTATANEGYIFMNWTENGTVVSTNATYSFTVTTERNLVANFFQLLETLSDDFNDGVIDPALWTYGGSSVYEADGLMKIEQNVTDDWVSLITRPMVPSSSGQIVMERSFKIHRSNDYYSGGFAIYLNNVFDNTSSTDVAPMILVRYFHDNWAGKYGTYVGATIDGQDTDIRVCDAVFDTWLTEKVILDMETGTLMYCLNNELVATAEIAGLSSLDVSYFTIRFWPYSWWTGHYHYMDYININTDLSTTFTVTTTAEPAEGGTVTGGGTYQLGDTCTISATPAEGYHFVNWTDNGNIVTTDVEYSFTVVADRNLVANFELNSYEITATAVPAVSGTVTGGGTYNHFETCTLTATPNEGCTFVNWTEDGVEVSTEAEYAFTVTGERNLEAHFVLTQTYNLAEGYIWWSTSIEQNGINGLGMLQDSLYGNATNIKSQSQFVNYNTTTGTWNGSLNSISNESGYIIHTIAPCAVTLSGQAAVPSEHAISMNTGWTWIGYLPSVAMDVNTALGGLAASEGDMLKSQHGFASYYPGYGWYGSLNTIQPGWGLMYKSNNSETVTFAYPDSNRGGTLRANLTPENNHWKPDTHAYPDNMSVMAVVELNGEEIMADGYELAAFDANGECRGSVRIVYAEPLNRYMAFLTLSGMDAAELYFGLYDAASSREYLDSDERLVFVTNAKVGDAHEPYVVRFGELTGTSESAITAQVYPNPVAQGERFSIDLGGSTTQPVRVEIVDALGEVTRSLTSVQHPVSIVAPAVSGVYLLRITVEGKGTVVRKLIVR